MSTTDPESSDFIIVGGGIAGLRAAAALAPAGRVVILTKADASESNTGYAQGGIAVAMARGDSVDLHVADTLAAGAGLCDEAAVRVLVADGPRYVRELIEWGARFDRTPDGELLFGLEAAHSVHRILHAGDATGREISRAMWLRVAGLPTVRTVNHALVTTVVVENGAAAGVEYFDEGGERRMVRGSRVLLATGGAGQVFRETTNPAVATGDGIALAYHAGARVADLEFVQFHPTALSLPGAPRFLISEALRGEGAKLVNGRGEKFMPRYDRAGDLAPRDVVARGIVREVDASGGPVYLTLQHLDPDRVRDRFPTIAEMCRRVGIDIARDLIPVGPAAHYMMGGIDTDEWGRTSVPGLFAAGETACTGVHGANRLASNSLLEGLVFGARAGDAMQRAAEAAAPKADRVTVPLPVAEARPEPEVLDSAGIRDLMWRSAGLFRTRDRLVTAVHRLAAACAAASLEARHAPHDGDARRRLNLATVAMLVAGAALRREESRGGHFRADFPDRDDLHWKVHLVVSR
ncbi:MAG TPA: L-aspartate oxidase [Vicinamibacterales bacterium]|nr:L-aspartate oxidase [Vicinamibacterales bacterium]